METEGGVRSAATQGASKANSNLEILITGAEAMDSVTQTRWWSKDTVAVVTGANKGIGLEIARQLAKQGITVVLTARDERRGREALEALKREGLQQVAFHLLDVTSEDSARTLAHWLRHTYGGIDILVNNAAIAGVDPVSVADAKDVISTNYDGVKRVTEALLPLLRHTQAGARILVVSSRLGQLQFLENKFREELADREHIEEATVNKFIDEFLQDLSTGSLKEKGWPTYMQASAYCVSKVAVNAYVSILHRALSGRSQDESIVVNSYTPGLTETDMVVQTMAKGVPLPRTPNPVDVSADTGVWVALQPPGGPSGKFWYERQEIEF